MNNSRISDQPPRLRVLRSASRYLGALLLVAIGVIHLYEYSHDHYSVIPVIGTLFALNFAGAVALALLIAVPIERLPRVGRPLLRLLMLTAIGFAAATIAGLLISEAGTLFGFHEQGYRTSITLSLAFEAAAIVVIGLSLALHVRSATAGSPRSPGTSRRDVPRQGSRAGLPVEQGGA